VKDATRDDRETRTMTTEASGYVNECISDVELVCNGVECGYRIVELRPSGCHAFVWGNIPAKVGDRLPIDDIKYPTADRGVEIYGTYEEAVAAWTRCAEALEITNEAAAAEMMAPLS
jgi:hypothetical protein